MEKHACTKPCGECPFTKNSIPGYLGGVYKNGQDLHNIVVNSEKPFSCHVAQGDNDISFEQVGTKEYPFCAGALMYMKKICKMPRDRELNKLVQSVDKSKLDYILSLPELIEHHSKPILFIDNHDYSLGCKSSEEVKKYINFLTNERKTIKEFSFFGDNNWLRIDTQLDILNGEITEEFELSSIDLDEMSYNDCINIFDWLEGHDVDVEFE